jgi:hypothetical protein
VCLLAQMLTVGTADSYSYKCFYEDGSETIGVVVHRRRPAAAQLMSFASSPGRTWPILIAKRQLPILVAALAARFPHGGAWIARLSKLARATPAPGLADCGSEGNFRCQSNGQSNNTGILGHVMVSLLVEIFSRCS